MFKGMNSIHSVVSFILFLGLLSGCATGEDKREGTSDRPQPAVGTTFEQEGSRSTTGTAPPGDTAGVNARQGVNDQIGPTGGDDARQDPDWEHEEAPAY